MMKYILSIFIILGIVCVSSCKFPAPDNNIQEDEIDVMEGKISITIPLIHPRLV